MEWARILAHTTGTVDQELLLRNEYLAAENRILRAQLNGCLRLSDAERATLGEIGFRLGRKALSEVATVAQPDTILAWHRRLIARKFEGSRARRVPGRPRIDREVEELIIRMAEENRSWGSISGTVDITRALSLKSAAQAGAITASGRCWASIKRPMPPNSP
jgi:putative transposase